MNKDKKRKIIKNSEIILPIELWDLIATFINKPKDWYNLTLSVPIYGLFTLNKNIQSKFKKKFTRYWYNQNDPKIHLEYDPHDYISYTLPNGKLHNESRPAMIVYDTMFKHFGQEEWYRDGIYHRDNDKPALYNWYFDSDKIRKGWWNRGQMHRDGDQPAWVHIRKNGKLRKKEWWKNNKKHREIGPAIIEYHKNGNIKRKEWWTNGKRHRSSDKAVVKLWYENGNKRREEQWCGGRLSSHMNTPAIISWWPNGKKQREEWWKDGYWFANNCHPEEIHYNENGHKTVST